MSEADNIRVRMYKNQQLAIKAQNADREELESKSDSKRVDKEIEKIVKNLNGITNESN